MPEQPAAPAELEQAIANFRAHGTLTPDEIETVRAWMTLLSEVGLLRSDYFYCLVNLDLMPSSNARHQERINRWSAFRKAAGLDGRW
jgi:hypothetical protein